MQKPNLNLSYREQGGMLLPNIQISNCAEDDRPLGRYGRMALSYLRDNYPDRYTALKMDGSLMETMHRVQREATEQIERLTQQMLMDVPMPVTDDILERTRHWNDLKSMAEETILQAFVLVER
ncbi:MAG: TnpV protein [Flavonifractor plautii]|nr:TnpV protein [Flavonifractor plautii]MDU6289948.1 TnpV protein [Flavonifractor plautii]MDU6342808.1 TnpV protein [Flavonifractor plautii]